MTFKEHQELVEVLTEALKIIKKADQSTDGQTGTIATVKGYDIKLTKHVHDTRAGEGKRGGGILKTTYRNIVQKLLDLKKNLTKGYYHLLYKVDKAYHDMVVYINGKTINVVTVMQHDRKSPDDYHVKPGDKKIVIEKTLGQKIETIDLGEIEL